jgi:hypothetical protein
VFVNDLSWLFCISTDKLYYLNLSQNIHYENMLHHSLYFIKANEFNNNKVGGSPVQMQGGEPGKTSAV